MKKLYLQLGLSTRMATIIVITANLPYPYSIAANHLSEAKFALLVSMV